MSSSDTEMHPEEKVKAGPGMSQTARIGTAGGLVLLVAAVVYGLMLGDGGQRFFHGYLVAFTYVNSFALGGLFFVLIMHLIGAKWSVVLRRVAECLTQAFPLLAVLSAGVWLPMLLGNDNLYIWSSPDLESHLVHEKAGYLNAPFFVARTVIYYAVWIGISRYFYNLSVKQDESGDPELSKKMVRMSAPAMFAFAFSTAFFGFDYLMSIEPEWFSTMFGVIYFAGAVISVFALLILITLGIQRSGRLTRSVTVEHYHDLGKLLFAFVFFWGYVVFSQFMLIWGANIPEETGYFMKRWFTGEGTGEIGLWGWFTLAMLALHFAIPFVLLMSRHSKRRLKILAGFALWMLFFHYFDLYWEVMPALNNHVQLGHEPKTFYHGALLDGLLWVSLGLLFMGSVARAMTKVNLIPVKDPNLGESLKFENV